MERLEPILKQKFWILLGVGILLTITGWWLATGSLAATIKTRTGEVEAAFKMIPSGEIPNDKWSAQLAARNTEQERAVRYTKALLWERQLSRMTWPEEVRQHVWQNGYRGEIGLEGREEYRTAYAREVRRVWESVLPFRPSDGTGIVAFGADQKVLPQRTWGMSAPASAEMWDAQEDLWLLESLLRTIVDVNGGPTAQRGDASIHVIETLKLMGGQPPSQRKSTASPAAAGPAAPGGMSAAPAGVQGGGAASAGGFGGGAGGMGGAGAGQTAALGSADFDPKDEIGSDGSAGGGGAGGGVTGGMGAMKMGPSAAHSSGPAAAGGGAGAGAGAGGSASGVRRYVEDDPTLPYKSRAFYITVLMDHRKIPSLVAELSASEKSAWPVEILRIQMVRLHDNDIDSRGGASPGRGGGFSPMAGATAGRGAMSSPGAARVNPGFSLDGDDDPMREGTNNPNAAGQVVAAASALESALQDPFIARVAILGIITLYNPVKPEPVASAVAQPVPAAGTPAAGTPAARTLAPADPATSTNPAPTDPATPAPAATPSTDGNVPVKPEVPAGEVAPAKPTPAADPAVPAVPPDAPKTPATTGKG